MQDGHGLDRNLNYLLWLYRRNYSDEDDRLVPIIERVGRWYMHAYQLHAAGEAVSFLVKADDLYDEAARNIVRQYGENARQLVSILYRTAIINYQIANDVSDVFIMSHRDIRVAMIPNKRPSPYLNEVAIRDYYFDQSFYKGRRSLNRIISLYESELPGSVLDYAQALVYRGDYYLALNRKWNAMKDNKKAYAVLIEHSVDADDINAIFGLPRRVEPFAIPGNEVPVSSTSRYVDAIVNVPASGWPADIRVIATNPPNDAALSSRGRHAVAAIRFRPRFEDGKPVATKSVPLHYVFKK